MELADGGTAFFDEIGDLPLEMQVKLLRLIQEREFRAVGSLNWRKVDLRIIRILRDEAIPVAMVESVKMFIEYGLRIRLLL